MPLKLNSAAGGSVTLDVGSTASTYTLVFPSLSGTILTTDTSGNFVIPSGNLNLSGTGQRITGDFSSVPVANRVHFQTNVTNGATSIAALPNGTNTNSNFIVYNNPDPTNASIGQFAMNGAEIQIVAGIRGTGTYFPMTIYTSGSERMRIDTSGNVGIATSSPGAKFQVVGSTTVSSQPNVAAIIGAGVTSELLLGSTNGNTPFIASQGAYPLTFFTNATERMRIDSSGLVGIGTSSAAAYGTLTVGQSGQPTGSEPSSRPNIEIWQGSPSINDAGGIDLRGSSSGSGYGFRISAIDSTGVHLVIGNRSSSTTYTERMRIDSSGNVGIGTSNPAGYSAKIAAVATSDYSTAATFISNSSTVNWARTDWDNQNVAYNGIIYQDQSGLFNIRNDGANSIAFSTNGGNERMRIDSSGNVGIGTNSPSAPLNIYNNTASTGYAWIKIESGTSAAYAPRIQLSDSRTGAGAANYQLISGGNSGAFEVYDTTSSASRLLINSSGNVGIGTTSPATKLQVSGGSTTEVRVISSGDLTTGAASFVRFGGSNSAISGYVGYGGVGSTMDVFNTLSGAITFGTSNTERMRIDSSGRVTMPNQPYAAGSCSSAYTLSAGSFANGFDVIYGNVDINVGSCYNNTTGKFTAPVAGAYLVMYTVLINSGSSTSVDYRLSLSINNGQTMTGSSLKPGGLWPSVYISNIVYLNANDTVKARFWNDSGTGAVHADPNYNRFSIMLLG